MLATGKQLVVASREGRLRRQHKSAGRIEGGRRHVDKVAVVKAAKHDFSAGVQS